MSDNEQMILLNLLSEHESERNLSNEWKLLYRASRDGFSSRKFHEKCDDTKHTISIIYTDNNNVFGGYTSIQWNSGSAWTKDENAFLFLLRSSENYAPKIFKVKSGANGANAIYCAPGFMCWFGYDIVIYSGCNKGNQSYTYSHYYDIPSKHYLNGDKQSFNVRELEVYAPID